LIARDPFGKPLHIFPDHALARVRGAPASTWDDELTSFAAKQGRGRPRSLVLDCLTKSGKRLLFCRIRCLNTVLAGPKYEKDVDTTFTTYSTAGTGFGGELAA
jgi:hypothetical protein